jgi:hypothetical protein
VIVWQQTQTSFEICSTTWQPKIVKTIIAETKITDFDF